MTHLEMATASFISALKDAGMVATINLAPLTGPAVTTHPERPADMPASPPVVAAAPVVSADELRAACRAAAATKGAPKVKAALGFAGTVDSVPEADHAAALARVKAL